jgi:hypothetical protein
MDEHEHAPFAEQSHEYMWDFLEHFVEPTGGELELLSEMSPNTIASILENYRSEGPEDTFENLPYLDALAYFARIELGKLIFEYLHAHPFGISQRDPSDGGKPLPETLSGINKQPPSKIPRHIYPRLLGQAVRKVMPHVPDKETSLEISRAIMSIMQKNIWIDRKKRQAAEMARKHDPVARPKSKRRTNAELRQMSLDVFENRKTDGMQDELIIPGIPYKPYKASGYSMRRPRGKRRKPREKIPEHEQLGSLLAQADEAHFVAVFGRLPER